MTFAMDMFLSCQSKHKENIAVDTFLNCYVYVLCTASDVWFNCCCVFFCDGALSIALLRLCMMNRILKMSIKVVMQNKKLNMSGSVALSRGSALPLPLRLNMSGHAALSSQF